jgi:hypothetical protein
MSYLFVMLFFASVGALIWGVIKPFRLFSKKKLSRRKIVAIFGTLAVVMMILTGVAAPDQKVSSETQAQITQAKEIPTSQPSANPTTKPTSKPAEKPKTESKPATKDPKQVLEDICAKYKVSDNCIVTQENGKWTITTIYQTEDDFMLFATAKQIARDFIFAIYATELPISHASISINNYQAKAYYRAGLGGDVSKTQPQSTWTNNDVGPTIFYDFLKSHTNGTAGDGQNSTYIETNLH